MTKKQIDTIKAERLLMAKMTMDDFAFNTTAQSAKAWAIRDRIIEDSKVTETKQCPYRKDIEGCIDEPCGGCRHQPQEALNET